MNSVATDYIYKLHNFDQNFKLDLKKKISKKCLLIYSSRIFLSVLENWKHVSTDLSLQKKPIFYNGINSEHLTFIIFRFESVKQLYLMLMCTFNFI